MKIRQGFLCLKKNENRQKNDAKKSNIVFTSI